jgi:hypothetical protein
MLSEALDRPVQGFAQHDRFRILGSFEAFPHSGAAQPHAGRA